MFHNRRLNNKINRLHERALRLVYNDETSSFKDLLERDGSVTMHQRNLKFLALELYKSKMGVSPTLVGAIFEKKK